ncbi:hypothetical protein BDY21DRAFT_369485 [Lineolata rhizophorae]|uniref:Calcium uniporter protein, mitochondrial n=1 Tax=Lineolata rhizophorae TaxID=578093 RepID=A0A6A6P9C9_9PEZI|nr:hypothetical protein BDY21DRAFT_369485 [Lineolata rhizophorae]
MKLRLSTPALSRVLSVELRASCAPAPQRHAAPLFREPHPFAVPLCKPPESIPFSTWQRAQYFSTRPKLKQKSADPDRFKQLPGELNNKVTPEEKEHYERTVAESTQSGGQVRTPWQREGAEEKPVKKPRSASAMTKGKLLTTPSRMLKLVIPLTISDHNTDRKDVEPLALLVHPQQPLSYLERLIQAELPLLREGNRERVPNVWFRAEDSMRDSLEPRTPRVGREKGKGGRDDEGVQVAQEKERRDQDAEEEDTKEEREQTSVEQDEHEKMQKEHKEAVENPPHGDAAEDAQSGDVNKDRLSPQHARQLRGGPGEGGVESYSGLGHETASGRDDESSKESSEDDAEERHMVRWSSSTEIGDFIRDAARGKEFAIEIENAPSDIRVGVPSFGDRTYYLRMRLRSTSRKIAQMADVKRECDELAKKGAQRFAFSGLGVLCAWWYLVYRLTFETDLGWDVMEPVTYLVGLTTFMGGYVWFLYHNREVSYRTAMNVTISRRQSKLYEQRGFDLAKWEQLIEDGNALRREIRAVATEYDVEWDELRDEKEEKVAEALRKERDPKKDKDGDSDSHRDEGSDKDR